MRLLMRGQNGELSLTEELFDEIPPYAILSHTWSEEASEEVTFRNMEDGTWRSKPGSAKIKFCSEQAMRDGLEYAWVDTCCINKSTMDEVQLSINSMFQWYRGAAHCYVYLSDVSMNARFPHGDQINIPWEAAFRSSKWFTRGWTLQELLAPASVQFFSQEGLRLGDKVSLEREIHDVTKIAISALRNAGSFSQFDVDERLRWAETRQTTRTEDWAYCLFGIFGVFMPLNYGEGRDNAVRRLRREIESTPKRQGWLQKLYSCPYQDCKDRNPPRVEGTCQWFTSHPRFQQWQQNTAARLLWVSADPGCGKSVLSKYLVDEILPSTTTRTTCYFFFKDDSEDQQSSVSALCSILHQIFDHYPASFSTPILDELEEKGATILTSFGSLWNLFLSSIAAQKSREIICILDALDECETSGRDQLINAISKFCIHTTIHTPALKFLLTSRPYLDIKRRFRHSGCNLNTIHLQGDGEEEASMISSEIDIVIRSRAARISQTLSLTQEEHDVLTEELTRVPSRTYLWVHLVFDEIQSSLFLTPGRIRLEVRSMPHTVSEAYERILSKSRDLSLTRKLLHIVVAAVRPLTLQEIALALAIGPNNQSVSNLDAASEERFRDDIRQLCGLFVVIIDSKVYLLHQTAREFLVAPLLETMASPRRSTALQWQYSLHLEESHRALARICLLRLSLPDFDPHGFGASSSKYQYIGERTFLQYAAQYWTDHFRQGNLDGRDWAVEKAISLCRSDLPSWVWFKIYEMGAARDVPGDPIPSVLVASYFGLTSVLRRLPKKDLKHVKVEDSTYGRSAVFWAAMNGHIPVLLLLLQGSMVRRLLWTGATINAKDKDGDTPLHQASWAGHDAVVKQLLKEGATVNMKNNDGDTPLHLASRAGHDAIVRQLLKKGANINAKDKDGGTPLHLASLRGHDVVVQRLLEDGANINAKDQNGDTPLHLASWSGHSTVVQNLLKEGANINMKDNDGDTPLHLASKASHSAVVQQLESFCV